MSVRSSSFSTLCSPVSTDGAAQEDSRFHKIQGFACHYGYTKGAEYDIIQSLDLGADDYIVKPFGVMELISRIKAVLRRYQPAQSENVLKMGGIVLHLDERTLTIDGERVQVTYKEFELLRLFMSHPGIAFTRDELFSNVWGMNYAGETRTVDMHIRTLRQKLGKYGELIETVRHVGYRMEKAL